MAEGNLTNQQPQILISLQMSTKRLFSDCQTVIQKWPTGYNKNHPGTFYLP
jgi:hypothetical protein